MPDLAGMNQARAFKDINDDRFMRSPFKESLEDNEDVLESMVMQQQRMSKQLLDTLKRMDKSIGISKRRSILTEDLEIDIDEEEDEEGLVEEVFDEDEMTEEDLVIEHTVDEILKEEEDV